MDDKLFADVTRLGPWRWRVIYSWMRGPDETYGPRWFVDWMVRGEINRAVVRRSRQSQQTHRIEEPR